MMTCASNATFLFHKNQIWFKINSFSPLISLSHPFAWILSKLVDREAAKVIAVTLKTVVKIEFA